jgi:hypothetical protein
MTKPTKKPKSPQPDFGVANKACRTTKEREQLALVLRARWTPAELHEYARLYYFKNGRDYPTSVSYRLAIADLAQHYHGMTYTDTKPSQYPHDWLKAFRRDGSKPMPPRREGLLQRGRGNGPSVTSEEYAWPNHTEEFRSLIEQRCRDYFKIDPELPEKSSRGRQVFSVTQASQEGTAQGLQSCVVVFISWPLIWRRLIYQKPTAPSLRARV